VEELLLVFVCNPAEEVGRQNFRQRLVEEAYHILVWGAVVKQLCEYFGTRLRIFGQIKKFLLPGVPAEWERSMLREVLGKVNCL